MNYNKHLLKYWFFSILIRIILGLGNNFKDIYGIVLKDKIDS